MLESKLLGTLLPSHPDLFPILERIREKYLIPEIPPDDDELIEILSANEIDWQAVRKEIEQEVRTNENILPESMRKIYAAIKKYEDKDRKSVV